MFLHPLSVTLISQQKPNFGELTCFNPTHTNTSILAQALCKNLQILELSSETMTSYVTTSV